MYATWSRWSGGLETWATPDVIKRLVANGADRPAC